MINLLMNGINKMTKVDIIRHISIFFKCSPPETDLRSAKLTKAIKTDWKLFNKYDTSNIRITGITFDKKNLWT